MFEISTVAGALDLLPGADRAAAAEELAGLPARFAVRDPACRALLPTLDAAVGLGLVECRPRWFAAGLLEAARTLPWWVRLAGRARRAAPGTVRPLAQLALLVTGFWGAPLLALAAASLLLLPADAAAVLVGTGVVLLASTALHEWGHLAVHRRFAGGDAPVVLTVGLGGCAVLHRGGGAWWQAALGAAAGPAVPAVVGAAVFALPGLPVMLGPVCLGVGLAHLGSLVLPSGDGANLRRALTARRTG